MPGVGSARIDGNVSARARLRMAVRFGVSRSGALRSGTGATYKNAMFCSSPRNHVRTALEGRD